MRFETDLFKRFSRRTKLLVAVLTLLAGYSFYVKGITENPPAFYIDEASVSYNAYKISKTGAGEFGHFMPLYFPVIPLPPPYDYMGYAEPTQIYIIAALNLFFPPSIALSRGVSATAMYFASLMLGFLAWRLSRQLSIALFIGITALITPWLFEIGRLAFGAALYPLMIVLFLVAAQRASRKESWSFLDILFLAGSLALTTYTYAVGRLLGPLLALGLIVFATNLKRGFSVVFVWIAYAITLVPFVIFHFQHPNALTGRFNLTLGYILADRDFWEMMSEFAGHFAANLNPFTLLLTGDVNSRHHIPESPAILAATLLLAFAGLVVVFLRHRHDAFWRFIIYGSIVSIIPASLTKDDFHTLRLSAFPVFLIILIVPALAWLLRDEKEIPFSKPAWLGGQSAKIVGFFLLLATVGQAATFQLKFQEVGPYRGKAFDANAVPVFMTAIEQPERPVYLADSSYYHAFWLAAVQGVDESNFVRVLPGESPPPNAVVMSEGECSDCEVILKAIPYILYKTIEINADVAPVESEPALEIVLHGRPKPN